MRSLGRLCHLCEFHVDVVTTTNTLEHIAGLLAAPDADKITWRIGQHLDEECEEDCRKALEGEQEAPSYSRIAFEAVITLDKGQAEGQPVSNGNSEVVGLVG